MLAIQTVPAIWSKDVWFSDEARHAAVLVQLVENGHWLVLHLGDTYYPDKPPLYFWMVAAISWLAGSVQPHIFMIGAAVSAALFLAVTHCSARLFGMTKQVALVAGLVLLANYYFIGRAHHPRMDLLFAAFITLSHVFFYKAAFSGDRVHSGWVIAAFVSASLAVLTKGPIGALLPFASFVLFLAKQRQLALFFTWPVAYGFSAFVAAISGYLIGVYHFGGLAFIREILLDQTWQRAVNSPRLSQSFLYYFHILPKILLPWSLILLVIPWKKIAWRENTKKLVSKVETKDAGYTYLWLSAATSFLLLSLSDYKITFLMITVLPQVVILIALFALKLERKLRILYFTLMALFYTAGIALLPFAHSFTLWPDAVTGQFPVLIAGLPLLAGVWLARKRSAVLFGLVNTIGLTMLALPFFLITIKNLDVVMSPRPIADWLLEMESVGFHPLYVHPYRKGIFDYHAGREIQFVNTSEQVAQLVASHTCIALVAREREWNNWKNKPSDTKLIRYHKLDYETFALASIGKCTS